MGLGVHLPNTSCPGKKTRPVPMATEVPAPVQAKASVVPPLPVFFRLDAAGVITEYKYNEMQKACDGRRAGAGFLFPPKVRGKKRALEVTAQAEIAEEDQE